MNKKTINEKEVVLCINDLDGIKLDIGVSITNWNGPWRTQLCVFHHGTGKKAKRFFLCFENGKHSEYLVELGSKDSQVGYTLPKECLEDAIETYNEGP